MKKEKFGLVALLPIKANSERVPGKNFRVFAGKPLFRWILDTLLDIPDIERVIINTDAADILKLHGLESSNRVILRNRREEICGDEVSMNKVIEDDLQNVSAETYLMTHTTNPLLSKETICGAIRAYRQGLENGKDSLFTVNRFQTRFYRADASPVNHDPANLVPTQNLEAWYEENSNLYLFSKNSFAETEARIGSSPALFETPPLESADIDDPTGWTQAEIFALSRQMVAAYEGAP